MLSMYALYVMGFAVRICWDNLNSFCFLERDRARFLDPAWPSMRGPFQRGSELGHPVLPRRCRSPSVRDVRGTLVIYELYHKLVDGGHVLGDGLSLVNIARTHVAK